MLKCDYKLFYVIVLTAALVCSTGLTSEVSKEQQLTNNIVGMWNDWCDRENLRADHPRRAMFRPYAKSLVEHVKYYQDHPTSIGGQLPPGTNVYYIVASMIIHETAMKHWLIGYKRGEVGLLQIHGSWARHGNKRRKIQNDYDLGMKLGIRWLAYHTQFCRPNLTGNINQWAETLSLYAAGRTGGMREDGQCKKISVARKRVNTAKRYLRKLK